MQAVEPDTKEWTASSRLLEDILDQAPPECFTLGWLMANLQQRSFGIAILTLGLLATTPVGSTAPGLMLAAIALQMIAGNRKLVFPQLISGRSLPTRYLFRVGEHAIPVMRYLEKAVHPRWPTAVEVTKPFFGVVVLLLTAMLLLIPVPLSNVAPAILIALISLAYLEQDGLLLCFALLAAVVLISFESMAVWRTIVVAAAISPI
jgi:hypothetical protein